ncbi:hypothetical protein M9979_05890 [Sphingomonas sp. RP10(2022)]|uniref:Uncharacterized protein n=1 Tax=Sphingomonas liriopis TaxID=2949094 RepID=A0A9X2HNT0_9SPHN|nr:hypothetical protein [Sphingomonas liriopis]MCP3734408.1 hypothetical protein [Sphingomonas liriopis]
MATIPDPRTAPDDDVTDAATPDATNEGVSNTDPAEGDDDAPTGTDGSPG